MLRLVVAHSHRQSFSPPDQHHQLFALIALAFVPFETMGRALK
jgi:hypothetical protein